MSKLISIWANRTVSVQNKSWVSYKLENRKLKVPLSWTLIKSRSKKAKNLIGSSRLEVILKLLTTRDHNLTYLAVLRRAFTMWKTLYWLHLRWKSLRSLWKVMSRGWCIAILATISIILVRGTKCSLNFSDSRPWIKFNMIIKRIKRVLKKMSSV